MTHKELMTAKPVYEMTEVQKREEARSLFIDCWAQAQESPEYNKAAWRRLQDLLGFSSP